MQAYGDGLAAADTTLTFVERLFYMIVGPVVRMYRSFSENRRVLGELKNGLGEWKDEAKSSTGRWRQPCLSRAVFESHFIRPGADGNNGLLEPPSATSCTAEFGWAQFLYALDIRPGSGIVSWRNLPKDQDPARTGVVSLLINDEAFCHITNLYQLYHDGRVITHPYDFNFDHFELPFGHLSTPQDNEDHSKFVFTHDGMASLGGRKLPFYYQVRNQVVGARGGNLVPREGTVEAWYNEALTLGASPRSLQLVNGSDTLDRRVASLLNAMDTLQERDWDDPCPYLVSSVWIEEASRVKRRVTTGGGSSSSLLEWIVEGFTERPDLLERLGLTLHQPSTEQVTVELRRRLREFCMFNGESFEFVWSAEGDTTGLFPSVPNPFFEEEFGRLLPDILKRAESMQDASWQKTLLETLTLDGLLRVLRLPKKITNVPVLVIQSRPGANGPSHRPKFYEILPN